MATPRVDFFTAHSVTAGGSLVFDWILIDQSGASITNPEQVNFIEVWSSTLAVDASNIITKTLTGAELIDINGNLVNQTALTGYQTGTEYSCYLTASVLDASLNPLSATIIRSGPLNKKVRGAIGTILPTFTVAPGDDHITFILGSGPAGLFSSYMSNSLEDLSNQYLGMYASIYTNNGTGFINTEIDWETVVANGLLIDIDASNGIQTEVYINFLSQQPYIAGTSLQSAGALVTATNLPNPPTEVATISTLEYNRYNAVDAYSVTDASSVSVLFNPPVGQDPSTNLYTIYKYDLSNNGYSNPTFDSSFNISVDASGVYTYEDSVGTPLTYQYLYVDTNVVAGRFYAYAISGTNDHGEGLLTSQYGVREGQKCSAPTISTTAGDGQITVNITPISVGIGGFDLSSNQYIIEYTPAGGATTYASGLSSGDNIITGLNNNVSYTFNAYASTTNSNYTTVGTVVSSSNTGPLLTYLSIISNTSTAIPYAVPPFPTQVATISTLEYNSYNAVDVYSVTDASSVSILFNASVGQDASAVITSYTIYKYDLSNNGYSNPIFDSSFNISADASGVYTYQDISGNPLTYSYLYVDTNVVAGRFYGYAISGTNIYTTSPLSPQYGVREGQKSSAPSITTTSGNGQITVNINASGIIPGGFDLSANGYIIAYTPSAGGATTYASGLSSGDNIITDLSNGTSYNFNAYASTTNSNYTTVGTDVSSNNTGPLLTYLSSISSTSINTPYVSPPAPSPVNVTLDYSANIPTGSVSGSWDASAVFNSSTVYFQYARSDASASWILTDGSGTAQQFQNSAIDVLGTSIYFYVRSFIVVDSNIVYSTTSTQSNSVTPFLPPSAPGLAGVGVNGLNVQFTVTPSVSSGGLVPVRYNAVVEDGSGNPLVTFLDISTNVPYVTPDLSANITAYVSAVAYVSGPDASGITQLYFSPPVTVLAGTTKEVPEITNQYIDSSGILWFTTNNNGSPLTFAESIIVDSSGVLNFTYLTNSGGISGDNGVMFVVSNTSTSAEIYVDFNDPNILRPQQGGPPPNFVANTLIVVANNVGANVYDTLGTP
jgi:hypothetical protein